MTDINKKKTIGSDSPFSSTKLHNVPIWVTQDFNNEGYHHNRYDDTPKPGY